MYLIIISSPSGGGKSTICNMIMQNDRSPLFGKVEFSTSVTTRSKRSHETNGKEYHFVTKNEFQAMVKDGDFLEWAEIFGNMYGTLKSSISLHKHTLFDIDFQGHQQITVSKLSNVFSIFLLPPSLETLQHRLELRGDVSLEMIKHRIAGAGIEISYAHEYSYIFTNNNIQNTFTMCTAIIDYIINARDTKISQNVLAITRQIRNLNNTNTNNYLKEALKITEYAYYSS